MSTPLRVVIVEDSEDDALLIVRELRRAGYQPTWQQVHTASDMAAALEQGEWEIVISDYAMPQFSALDALRIVQASGKDLPFIIVSGAIGEDVAVAAMKAGAHDYLMKGNLKRLVPAVARELQEAKERRAQRQAQEALRQAQKMESLGIMAGGVAHDFNNLLIALLAQNALALAKLPPGSAAAVHIEKAMKAARRATDLTRQMLAYAGSGRSAIEPIDLNEVVEENLHLLEASIPKHVHLCSRLAKNLPSIDADPGQIQQVIMNLILNAAEAIKEKSGVVTVVTGVQEVDRFERSNAPILPGDLLAPGRYVTLTVEDNGVGMDEATLPKVFDPFFTTKKRGRGLGLAAVLGIVRSHGGGLQVSSTPGKGTTFHLYFPAGEGQVTWGKEQEPALSLSRGAKGREEQLLALPPADGYVLVIDDEETVRETLGDILAFAGIKNLSAADGASGIALYQERADQIRLVLLDLSMPGLSGEETLRELFRLNPSLRVILSSGYDQTEVARRISPNWQVEFVQKPFDIEVLLGLVTRDRQAASA